MSKKMDNPENLPAEDLEAVLTEAAARCSGLVGLLKQHGTEGNKARLGELLAELAQVERHGAQVLASRWVSNERMAELTADFNRVSVLLLGEIKVLPRKAF